MRNRRVLAGLSALLLGSLGLAAGDDPQDVPVSVRIGRAEVRLSVHVHFADSAKGLPEPAELPVADAHDRGHGARTYCYRFIAKTGTILLELHDSDFGLHTATLSRVAPSAEQHCPTLSDEPEVLMGGARYRLSSVTWSQPPGFLMSKTRDALSLTREWTYSDSARPHMWGTCFSRSVSLTIEPPSGAARSLTVQNWEEPGC